MLAAQRGRKARSTCLERKAARFHELQLSLRRSLDSTFSLLALVRRFAAIPAAVFYNFFGNAVKEMGARMEDFALEFLNMTERNFEEPK